MVSQILSFLGTIFVIVQVYIGPPLALALVTLEFFSTEQNFLTAAIFGFVIIVGALLAIYAMLEFRSTYSGYLSPPTASAALEPLGMNAAFDKIWAEVATKLGIDRVPIRMWYRPLKAGINASAIRLKDGAHVLVSHGLLRSITRRPDVAKAVLFHEGAHIAQKDSRLWPKVDALLNVTRRIYLRIVMVLVAVSLISAFMSAIDLRPSMADPHAQDWVEARNLAILKSSGYVFLACLQAGFLLLLSAAVAWIRRRSEFNADLAARAFCGPSGLNAILESAASRETPKLFDYFESHPSATRRLQAAREIPGKRFVIKLACIALAFIPVYLVTHFGYLGGDLVGSFSLLFIGIFLFLFFAISFF